MPSLLAKVINWLRPRDGWAPFLLTLAALLCQPAALSAGGDSDQIVSLILLVLLALLTGLGLARSRLSARHAAILGGLSGLLLVALAVGRILPPLTLLWSELGYAYGWFQDWLRGELGWPLPFSATLAFAWQRVGALGTRLWWWGRVVAGDAQTQDQILAHLLTAYLVWAASVFATWQVYRRRLALQGLAPVGVIITVVAFFRGNMAYFYLAVYLFCTLWLVAICRLWRHTARWNQRGTDYPESLGMELTISYGPWLIMILVLATLFPVVYPRQLHEGFWQLAEGPWERVVSGAERFVGPIDDGYPGGPGTGPGEGGELPSARLLTGSPQLSDTPVLYVNTSDPEPPPQESGRADHPLPVHPRRYWRSRT
ncbi:MAG: hypothetical protein GWN58_29625, partial [Anaerolineae bacterium]|nr:hypothetical protein [Anaerolineae bacterium]